MNKKQHIVVLIMSILIAMLVYKDFFGGVNISSAMPKFLSLALPIFMVGFIVMFILRD
jgi:hypothetical protein